MACEPELRAWLSLALTHELRPRDFTRLLTAFGDPTRILECGRTSLLQHVHPGVADAIIRGPDSAALARAAAWLDDPANRIVTLADAEYPAALLTLSDPPPVLYAKGRLELLNRPALAVVGSRNATAQGLADAEAFSRALSEAGLVVISGLAAGIDAAAHRGALAGGSGSIAVVGTGLDIVYPARNRDLAHELAMNGTLLSEFGVGTPARPENFPRRNRLISGLALGCLVVEASLGSGSLITARCAVDQGREVFALPGSIHSPLSKGCHALIKQGAKLVEAASDVLEELRFAPAAPHAPRSEAHRALTAEERRLLDALGFDAVDQDTVAARAGLSAATTSALLTRLEIDGFVAALAGQKFQRIR